MAISIPSLPSVTHESAFYRPGFLSMAIVGKSGCGKTQLLSEILPGISTAIKTLLIATIVKDVPVHKAIVDWFNSKDPPRAKRPEHYARVVYDPDEMRQGTDMLQQFNMVSLDRPGLIIFDDFNDGRRVGPYWDFVIHAFTKLRNSGWHFIIIAQQPQFLPTIVRNCTTSRVLFDCYSHTALETFARDIRDRVPDKTCLERLIQYVHTVPYTYMMVREKPFDVVVGRGAGIKQVMDERNVMAPTYHEILSQIGVSNGAELDKKSAQLQAQAGNTSSIVHGKL